MKNTGILIALLTAAIYMATALAAEQPSPDSNEESLLQSSNRQLQQIELFRQQIAELESLHGPYDGALLEPLSGLTNVLIQAGEFEEANLLLNRRLQLLRTVDGPANLQQVPILLEAISNNIRLGEWRDVTSQFQFVRWLHSQDGSDLSQQLNAMDDVASWLLALVYLDNPRNRTRNFLDARQIQREILSLAESSWGEDSEQLIPWLYRQALYQFRLYAFISAEDELGSDAYEDIRRIESMSEEDYLRRGLNMIKRIRELVEKSGNAEAIAIAGIYEADFQTLLDLGTGIALYREAGEKLVAAGFAQMRVDAYLARPVVLPLNNFLMTLDELEKYTADEISIDPAVLKDEPVNINLGQFTAWNDSLPYSPLPLVPEMAATLAAEYHEVDLLFSINSRGHANNPTVVRAEPDTNRLRRDARDAIRRIQFRPRFENGRSRRVEDVLIRFRYPAPL